MQHCQTNWSIREGTFLIGGRGQGFGGGGGSLVNFVQIGEGQTVFFATGRGCKILETMANLNFQSWIVFLIFILTELMTDVITVTNSYKRQFDFNMRGTLKYSTKVIAW